MNKKLFILFLLFVLLLCLKDNMEGVQNQITPPEYEFATLTAPQDVMSGYFQAELYKSDSTWKAGNKKCHHILDKEDCSLVGDDGRLANDACLVECDTSPISVTIKKRQDVGDDLSVRGIDFEDSDEYNYLEIYDSIQNINGDVDSIRNVIDNVKKQARYFDIGSKCTPCFYDPNSNNIDSILNIDPDEYLEACPSECESYADCFLDSDKRPDLNCEL
jgi:hypothetical protein